MHSLRILADIVLAHEGVGLTNEELSLRIHSIHFKHLALPKAQCQGIVGQSTANDPQIYPILLGLLDCAHFCELMVRFEPIQRLQNNGGLLVRALFVGTPHVDTKLFADAF